MCVRSTSPGYFLLLCDRVRLTTCQLRHVIQVWDCKADSFVLALTQCPLGDSWQGQIGRYAHQDQERRLDWQGRGCVSIWKAGRSISLYSIFFLVQCLRIREQSLNVIVQDTHVDRAGRTLIRETLDDAEVIATVCIPPSSDRLFLVSFSLLGNSC